MNKNIIFSQYHYIIISTLFILNLKKSASKRTSHKIISKDFASFN